MERVISKGEHAPEKMYSAAELKQFGAPARTQRAVDIAAGRFPAPVRFGPRRAFWRESDLVEWQAGCAQATSLLAAEPDAK